MIFHFINSSQEYFQYLCVHREYGCELFGSIMREVKKSSSPWLNPASLYIGIVKVL